MTTYPQEPLAAQQPGAPLSALDGGDPFPLTGVPSASRRGELGDSPPLEDDSVLAHDAYDTRAWQEAMRAYGRLARTVQQQTQELRSAPALLKDVFLSLYKAVPQFVATSSPLGQVHAQILQDIMCTQDYEEMRLAGGTIGDALTSAMGTIALAEQALASLDEETRARLDALAQAQEQMQHLFAQAHALREAAQSQLDPALAARLAALAEQQQGEGAAAAAQVAPLLQGLQSSLQAQAPRLRQAARQALSEASAQARTWNSLHQQFGSSGAVGAGNTTGARTGGGLTDALELAQRLSRSRKLKQILALAGRLHALAQEIQEAKVRETPEEVVGVSLGRELRHLLPGELVLLDDPDTEWLFFKKFRQHRLAQYELQCRRLEAQGPLIVALDVSGSMHAPLPHQAEEAEPWSKEAWSKAVFLELLAIARQQERDVALLLFSDEVQTYLFPKGQASLEQIAACAEAFPGEGTNYRAWMQEALRIVDSATADVICISDGLANIDQEFEAAWNARRRERGMRVFSVLLDVPEDAGTDEEQPASLIQRVSDLVLPLQQLEEEAVLEPLFTLSA